MGDARGRSNIGSFAHPHRSDQRAVAADKDAVSDHGFMFVYAVIVAGDGSGADVHACADFCVAQVGKMIRLRSFAQLDLLSLDEVAHVRALADLAAGPQVRIGADRCTSRDLSAFHYAS